MSDPFKRERKVKIRILLIILGCLLAGGVIIKLVVSKEEKKESEYFDGSKVKTKIGDEKSF